MIKIRLQRRGRRKRPIHHIVVADSRAPRDGRIVEDLGRFDNVTQINQVTLNEDRAIYWIQQGAQLSDTVRSIFKNQGILYRMHLVRWGKSEEEIEEALAEWRENRQAKVEKEPSRKERQQAMLEAEEKEYQKQLKKKAEEAAKEKAKQEALAKAKEEEEAKAAAEEASEGAEEAEAAQETEKAPEAQEEQPEDEKVEDAAEEGQAAQPEAKDDEAEEEAAQEPEKEEEPEEEKAEETAPEEEKGDEEGAEAKAGNSTDMLAKEAIDHIENTPLEDLKGFVTDDEDRVTVQRAWEEKQEG